MRHALTFLVFLGLSAPLRAHASTVPFVGCPADGQVGPAAAPRGHAPRFAVPEEAAAKLAWYQAKYAPGVLAPRGWHCFATYGSSGATLYVSPDPLDSKLVFSSGWKGFSGPAVAVSSMSGGTSGRFEVARKVARLFPDHMDFVRQVIAEGAEPASNFPAGPYPEDTLHYKTKTLVDFETPAHKQGLGTESRLQAGDQPIEGFVFLSMSPKDDAYEISLEMRLPSDLSSLNPAIRDAMERILK